MKQLVLVDYPARIEDVDNMIATLGGLRRLSHVFSGGQKFLELRYHPKNPYNKSTNSEHEVTSGILVAVKIRRSKLDKSLPPIVETTFLGGCRKKYLFPNMCDFQYLPLYKEPTSSALSFNAKFVVPKSNRDSDFFRRTLVPHFSIPEVFARSDTIREVTIFRDDTHEDCNQDNLGIEPKPSTEGRDIIGFNMVDTFPAKPDPRVVKRMRVKYVSDVELQVLKKLFEQCPIWTRLALIYESKLSNDKMKCMLPHCSYYFSTGPWRALYVRYGYDPRKDFNSRSYQTFDYRTRFRSGIADYVGVQSETKRKMREDPNSVSELMQHVNYPYLDDNKLPRSRQCIMRYCDIHIPKVQEMLEKIPTPHAGAICNDRTGWLPVGFDVQVRQAVSTAVKAVLREYCRKMQAKNASAGAHACADANDVTCIDDDADDVVCIDDVVSAKDNSGVDDHVKDNTSANGDGGSDLIDGRPKSMDCDEEEEELEESNDKDNLEYFNELLDVDMIDLAKI